MFARAPPLPHSHPAAGTSPTLLGAPFGGSTVYAVHASQVLATPFSTLVNLLGVQPRLECVTINPMGTDLAYGTRVVVTTAGVRKQLMRLNLFTGAVTTFVTGTGYLAVNPSCTCLRLPAPALCPVMVRMVPMTLMRAPNCYPHVAGSRLGPRLCTTSLVVPASTKYPCTAMWVNVSQPHSPVRHYCRGPAALLFDCTGTLYALTANNGRGESYASPRSLVRISLTTGAATPICAFTTTEQVLVRAGSVPHSLCCITPDLHSIANRRDAHLGFMTRMVSERVDVCVRAGRTCVSHGLVGSRLEP